MRSEERDYYERRAEEEIEAARRSNDPAAVRAHYLLAGYYLDLVHNPESAETLEAAEPVLAAADALAREAVTAAA